MPRVLILQPIHAAGIQALVNAGIEVVSAPDAKRETLLATIPGFDGLVVRTTAYRIDGEVMDRAPGLKVIGRHGVGVDHIDLDAARARGIAVVNAPEANSQGVAEYTVGLMIAACRGIVRADAAVRRGTWEDRERLVGRELMGADLGIIGLGRVGSRVARICARGFAMRVSYYDIVRKPEYEAELGVVFRPFDEVLAAADILTLHVPLTPLTRRMIDAASLARMRRGSYLLNAARGEVVDLEALAAAIGEGHIAGAGIDVFPDEPLPTDHPILALPTVVASPHMASHSDGSMIRMALVTEDVARVLMGETPKFRVA